MAADSRRADGADVALFFVLACVITWGLDLPMVVAWSTGTTPSSGALAMVGLGAWGPTLAASIVVTRRGDDLRSAFGPWRAKPVWLVVGLLLPLAVQLPATLIDVALGGHPAHWFYPPVRPEHFAALVMFPLGEELGWRGFAYPRLERLYGPVLGSLILGCVWGLWHLGMLFTPDPLRRLPLSTVAFYMVDLALWSVVMAAIFERSGRSILVAIAIHAGEHIDNVSRAPQSELLLRGLRFAVLAVVAAIAARHLASASSWAGGRSSTPKTSRKR